MIKQMLASMAALAPDMASALAYPPPPWSAAQYRREIVEGPAEVLRKKCDPVPMEMIGTADALMLACELYATLSLCGGAGLAAPQISRPVRAVAIRNQVGNIDVLINPKIIWRSDRELSGKEECLSFPGLPVLRRRADHVRVEGYTPEGKVVERSYSGIFARCCLHELEHLDGETVYDHGSPAALRDYDEERMPPAERAAARRQRRKDLKADKRRRARKRNRR